MHYYQFNIGDYKSHTSGLSPIEDIAYRRLLDLYYLNERPFNGCSTDVARDIGMREYTDEVEYILNKFFPLDGDQWVNKRAEEEIRIYRMKKKTASKAGKASGKARRSKANERVFNSVEPTNNHKPITIPLDINPTSWEEFEQHRKEMRQPLTELARTKAQNIIKGLSFEDQAEVINNTIQNRWRGLFPDKLNGKGNGTNQRPGTESNHAKVMRRLSERIASE